MRVELRTESFTPELKRHPFFHRYGIEDPVAIRQLCTNAITELSLLSRHELFSDHSYNVHMFFVLEGHLEYLLPCACAALDNAKKVKIGRFKSNVIEEEWEMEDLFDEQEADASNATVLNPFDVVSKGAWACEIALWLEKYQLCSPFVAVDKSEILLVDTAEFQQVALKHQPSLPRVLSYAKSFCDYLPKMTKCRWRVALCNDKDILQELVRRDFEDEFLPTSRDEKDRNLVKHAGEGNLFKNFGRISSMQFGRRSVGSSADAIKRQSSGRHSKKAFESQNSNHSDESIASVGARANKSLASMDDVSD
jgi:hypothetical protein